MPDTTSACFPLFVKGFFLIMKQEMVQVYTKKTYGYVLQYDRLSPASKSLPDHYNPPGVSGNYNKQWIALLVIEKSAAPSWVKWTHHLEGKTHCDECLKLDGCWFLESKSPVWTHHRFCHCTLDPIDYAEVFMRATTVSYTHLVRTPWGSSGQRRFFR